MLDLLVLGNLIVDDVVYRDGTTRMGQPGGAVLYVALAARLFGLRVGIASRVGDDYPRAMIEALEDRVDVSGIEAMDGSGLRIWLLDEGDRRQVVHRLAGPSHAEACPEIDSLPADWQLARAIHLAPMPCQVQSRLVQQVRKATGGHCLLSLDPFDLMRDDSLVRWRDLISKLDVFFLSQDEMLLSGEAETVLPDLASDATLVFKRAARGGVLWSRGQELSWPGFASKVVDPTGAGDAFAAGFLAGRLAGESVDGCVRHGAVAASFAIEGVGPAGLLEASPADVGARLADLTQAWAADGRGVLSN